MAPSDLVPMLQDDDEDMLDLPRTPRRRRVVPVPALAASAFLAAVILLVPSRHGMEHNLPEADFLGMSESKGGHSKNHSKKNHSKKDVSKKDVKVKESAPPRQCKNMGGLQLAEPKEITEGFPACSKKWAEDCSDTGCCADAGMKCFQKERGDWSACKQACEPLDDKNESWTCWEVPPPPSRTAEGCADMCQKDKTCKQAVFSADAGGSCHLSKERIPTVVWAGDNFNSTFCGTDDEEDEIQTANDKVWKQIPFQITIPMVNCSWGGDDCSKTRCCNDVLCDKNFKSCSGFSCYKKNQYFMGCAAEPLEGWDGKWMGGPRDHRALPGAASQVALQGSSLYCFSVVSWDAPAPKPFWNSEAELANNWKSQGLHVLQCDGHDILDGVVTEKAEWGSFSNIDMFMDIWQQVKGLGNWANYDWTVKADADAVFLPQRLKDHLFNLRTPKGARVYLENINYKFKFMGAIEIMTKEALELFLDLGHTCIRGKHEGGEDSFLKACLDGLGVDHQEDWLILRDKYAGLGPPCDDGWAVAYHYMKKSHDWSTCYNEVMCGSKMGKGCDQAAKVPYEPGYKPYVPAGGEVPTSEGGEDE